MELGWQPLAGGNWPNVVHKLSFYERSPNRLSWSQFSKAWVSRSEVEGRHWQKLKQKELKNKLHLHNLNRKSFVYTMTWKTRNRVLLTSSIFWCFRLFLERSININYFLGWHLESNPGWLAPSFAFEAVIQSARLLRQYLTFQLVFNGKIFLPIPLYIMPPSFWSLT